MFHLKQFFSGATHIVFRATQAFLVAVGLITVAAALPHGHAAPDSPATLDAIAGNAPVDNVGPAEPESPVAPLVAPLRAASGRVATMLAGLRPIAQANAGEPASGSASDPEALPVVDAADLPASAAEARRAERLATYLAHRYNVSERVVSNLVVTADRVGQEMGIDPLLIVAVMAVESSFNPLAESNAGAQGLMQVMPRYHLDKAGPDAHELSLFDAHTNIRVGAMVLRETISRAGSIHAGLQFYNGAPNDPESRYAGKVLSIRERLAGVAHG